MSTVRPLKSSLREINGKLAFSERSIFAANSCQQGSLDIIRAIGSVVFPVNIQNINTLGKR